MIVQRVKSKTKFRFWLGGPRAFPGDTWWMGKTRFWYGRGGYINGCSVVREGGFEIPEDTYYYADLNASQGPASPMFSGYEADFGRNYTALLPIEVEE